MSSARLAAGHEHLVGAELVAVDVEALRSQVGPGRAQSRRGGGAVSDHDDTVDVAGEPPEVSGPRGKSHEAPEPMPVDAHEHGREADLTGGSGSQGDRQVGRVAERGAAARADHHEVAGPQHRVDVPGGRLRASDLVPESAVETGDHHEHRGGPDQAVDRVPWTCPCTAFSAQHPGEQRQARPNAIIGMTHHAGRPVDHRLAARRYAVHFASVPMNDPANMMSR